MRDLANEITEETLHTVVDTLNERANERLLTEVALFARNAVFLEKPGSKKKVNFHEPSLIFGILLGIQAADEVVNQ